MEKYSGPKMQYLSDHSLHKTPPHLPTIPATLHSSPPYSWFTNFCLFLRPPLTLSTSLFSLNFMVHDSHHLVSLSSALTHRHQPPFLAITQQWHMVKANILGEKVLYFPILNTTNMPAFATILFFPLITPSNQCKKSHFALDPILPNI